MRSWDRMEASRGAGVSGAPGVPRESGQGQVTQSPHPVLRRPGGLEGRRRGRRPTCALLGVAGSLGAGGPPSSSWARRGRCAAGLQGPDVPWEEVPGPHLTAGVTEAER